MKISCHGMYVSDISWYVYLIYYQYFTVCELLGLHMCNEITSKCCSF